MQKSTGAQRQLFPVEAAALPHGGIRRAVEFIHQHYHEKHSLEEIAAEACLSQYHFCRLFHRVVGISYHEYVTLMRIEKAKALLQETPYHSITEIGYEIGFGGLRNFESCFKKLTGQTPCQYRIRFSRQRATPFAKSAISIVQFWVKFLFCVFVLQRPCGVLLPQIFTSDSHRRPAPSRRILAWRVYESE